MSDAWNVSSRILTRSRAPDKEQEQEPAGKPHEEKQLEDPDKSAGIKRMNASDCLDEVLRATRARTTEPETREEQVLPKPGKAVKAVAKPCKHVLPKKGHLCRRGLRHSVWNGVATKYCVGLEAVVQRLQSHSLSRSVEGWQRLLRKPKHGWQSKRSTTVPTQTEFFQFESFGSWENRSFGYVHSMGNISVHW